MRPASLWLPLARSCSLRLPIALRICIQHPRSAHKALAQPVAALLRCNTFCCSAINNIMKLVAILKVSIKGIIIVFLCVAIPSIWSIYFCKRVIEANISLNSTFTRENALLVRASTRPFGPNKPSKKLCNWLGRNLSTKI